MIVAPTINPVAFSLGPLSVHWYGLMYLAGFALFWGWGLLRSRQPWRGVAAKEVEDLLFYGVLGIIVGGRLGFCLLYQPGFYLTHPLEFLSVWKGGMSAHGGVIGALVVLLGYSRARGKSFFTFADFVAPMIPWGIAFGRIGNFINGELWGRAADPSLPWAMVFPRAMDNVARHPSQLYEAAAEGLLLGILLWAWSRRPRALGSVGALFFLGYGLARFLVEWFREPDAYLGLQALGLSRGQWLSLPMILVGAAVLVWSLRRGSRP